MIYYFAYGMLTNPDYFPENSFVSTGILHGYEFELFQHANIKENTTKCVHGAVWEISEEQLSYLDMVEGYPQYYSRKLLDIDIDGNIVQAYVYIMTNESRDMCLYTTPLPSYIKIMMEGYNICGISIEQLNNELDFI